MGADDVDSIAEELYAWIQEERHRSEIRAMGFIACVALIGLTALWVGGIYAVLRIADSSSPGFLEALMVIIVMLAITAATVSVVRPVLTVMEWSTNRISSYYGKTINQCKVIPDNVAQGVMSVEEAADQLLTIANQQKRR